MNLRELESISRTEYDYSMESLSSFNPNVANFGIGWMWRPQRDILANLFLSANDDKLAQMVREMPTLSIDKEILDRNKTKMFYRGERLKDTKELLANARVFVKAVQLYLDELKEITGRVSDMDSSGKWEDVDKEHYEDAIKLFGEGFGGRKLKRKSLMGMYTVVLLDGDSVNKTQLVDIKHNASKADFIKVMGELYETYLELKKASEYMGKIVKITMGLRAQFKTLNPYNYAVISKYYAAGCNPYIGLVRLSNQMITSLSSCAHALSD